MNRQGICKGTDTAMTDFRTLVRGTDAIVRARTTIEGVRAVAEHVEDVAKIVDEIRPLVGGVEQAIDDAANLLDQQPAATAALDQARESLAAIESSGNPLHTLESARTSITTAHAAAVDALSAAPRPSGTGLDVRVWNRAASLVESGAALPDSFRRTTAWQARQARVATIEPADLTDRVLAALQKPNSRLDPDDLLAVARVMHSTEGLSDDLAASLAELHPKDLRLLERAARLVDAGYDLPESTGFIGRLVRAKASLMQLDTGRAMRRLRELVWHRDPEVRAALPEELELLREFPDPSVRDALRAVRPGDAPTDAQLRAIQDATVGDPNVTSVIRGLRDAIDQLDAVARSPRSGIHDELRAISAQLDAFEAMPMGDAERAILDRTKELVQRNQDRLSGARRDGYGHWTDLGEIGRIAESARLLDSLGTTRIIEGVDDVSRPIARVPAPAPAAAVDDAAAGAAEAADEALSW